jgi:hypothetical protein
MAESVLRGMAGEAGVYEAAYVASSVTELPFFASKARRLPPQRLRRGRHGDVCCIKGQARSVFTGAQPACKVVVRGADVLPAALEHARSCVDKFLVKSINVLKAACWKRARWHGALRLARAQVRLGPNGVEEVLGLGPLSALEEKGVAELKPVLQKNIETGVAFAQSPPKVSAGNK